MTRRTTATSAGILLFRGNGGDVEVLLAHPGGPLWARKDDGVWTIPKGRVEAGETPLAAARREFHEEMGMRPDGDFIPLQPRRQPSGKLVHVWAVRAEFDPDQLRSNLFSIEWPPRSGRRREFAEVDRAAWFRFDAARRKILKGQAGFLDDLERLLTSGQPLPVDVPPRA